MFSRGSAGNAITNLWLSTVAILCAVLFTHCAAPVPPYGGPKDNAPPAIVEDESTTSPMLNYSGEDIRVTFNEWVKLNNPAQQIVISPPMSPRPQFNLKGKTLIIDIPEEVDLAENTTYTINFGESIQDITEGNVLKNFTFVFSTGSYVDSLSLHARVVNARTGKPEPDVLVVLHENPVDTAFRRTLPAYFASTGSDGTCAINYLRSDTFYMYALKDQNANFMFDQPTEMIGFYNEPVMPDTAGEVIDFVLFENKKELFITDLIDREGKVKIVFTRIIDSLGIEPMSDEADVVSDYVPDTLFIWHQVADTVDVILKEMGEPFDTIQLKPFAGDAGQVRLNYERTAVHLAQSISFVASRPLIAIDTSRIELLLGDSLEVTDFQFNIEPDRKTLKLESKWQENANYNITFLPGAFTDLFDIQNDTIHIRFGISESIDFVTLEVQLNALSIDENYNVRLIDKNRILRESRLKATSQDSLLTFVHVPIGTYQVHVFRDENQNGRWDTGDLGLRKQPEEYYIQDLDPMRAGWDVNVLISWPGK